MELSAIISTTPIKLVLKDARARRRIILSIMLVIFRVVGMTGLAADLINLSAVLKSLGLAINISVVYYRYGIHTADHKSKLFFGCSSPRLRRNSTTLATAAPALPPPLAPTPLPPPPPVLLVPGGAVSMTR